MEPHTYSICRDCYRAQFRECQQIDPQGNAALSYISADTPEPDLSADELGDMIAAEGIAAVMAKLRG